MIEEGLHAFSQTVPSERYSSPRSDINYQTALSSYPQRFAVGYK